MKEEEEIKKAWKIWGKSDGDYERHYADTYWAENVNKAKAIYAARNCEDYTNAVAKRAPESDLYLFEGEWLTQVSIQSKICELERKAKIASLSSNTMYMVQDKRSYVGNSVLWWAQDGNGYTTDYDKAWVLTADEIRSDSWRSTDVIWNVLDVADGVKKHVDMQCLDRDKGL